MGSRRFFIPLAACALIGLSACTTPVREPVPEPSPAPTAEPAPVSTRPEPQIPVTCDESPLPSAVGDFFGRALVTDPVPLGTIWLAAMEQRGQLWCQWLAGDRSGSDTISAWISIERDAARRIALGDPGYALPGQPLPLNRCLASPVDSFQCSYGTVVGDYLISVSVSGAGTGDVEAMRAMMAAAMAPVERALLERPVPAAWTAAPDGLPLVADCVGRLGEVPVGDIMGDPGVTLRDVSGFGEDGTVPREAAAIGGETDCEWSPTSTVGQTITVVLLSSGAWYWDALAPVDGSAREAIELPGAEHAAISCADERCAVEATVGVDALRVTGGTPYSPYSGTIDQLVEIATAVAAAVRA